MTGSRPREAGRLAWFGLGVAATIIALSRVYDWVQVATGNLQGPDFFSFYAAARLIAARGGGHLYEAAAQQYFQDQVTSAWSGRFILLPFLHPPYYALLISPLGALTLHQAYVVMGAVSGLALAAALVVLSSGLRLAPPATWIAAALSVSFLPVFVVFVQGQSDMLILLPLCLSYVLWVRGAPGWAGFCAGLAIIKPQLVLLIPVVFLARRSTRALAGYVLGAGALLAASFPFFGIRGWSEYLGVIAPWVISGDRNFPITGQTVFSLRGLLEVAPGGRPVALALLAVAAVAAVWVIVRASRGPGPDLAFAVSASLVLSPYQNLHDLSLLVLPGIAAAALVREGVLRHHRMGWTVLLLAYLAVDVTVLFVPQTAAIASLALAMYLAWECWDLRPASGPRTTAMTAS